MRKTSLLCVTIFLGCFSLCCSNEKTENGIVDLQPYAEEAKAIIERGLVALPKDENQIFLSWRLLPNDPESVSFNVYRKETAKEEKRFECIAQTDRTSYLDSELPENEQYSYVVRPIYGEKQGDFSGEATVAVTKKGQSALVFDVGQDYKQARVVTGDLNGDGELEVVIAYSNNWDVDPWEKAWKKSEATIKVAAFLHTGERLWDMDLGWGIESGGNYSPMVVWDIDTDGCAEVLLKTNKSDSPLNYESERLTILDGKTGKVKNEAKWPPAKGLGEDYSSNSRNYIAIAHLDGKDPYIIVARGLYFTQRIWAYDNTLNRVWERIIGIDLYTPKGILGRLRKFSYYDDKFNQVWSRLTKKSLARDRTRGSHMLPIADINEDGKEEIMWGEHCIGEDGRDLWVIERTPYNGHPDVVFVADVLPSNEGKEVFYCREGWNGKDDKIGMLLANNKGKIIWAHWGFTHIDGGWVSKIAPNSEGLQCYSYDVFHKTINQEGAKYREINHYLWSSRGELLGNTNWYGSKPVDWDGDGIREICTRKGYIRRYDGTALFKLPAGPNWAADIFGDHREEIIVTPNDGKVYVFFNTNPLESPPRITQLADRRYKNDLSRTAMQYGRIPTEGGYIPKKHKEM